MKCSVFIAISADGFIATNDGNVDWLQAVGRHDVDLGEKADMGFLTYIASVDCMIMGRGCMEKLAEFKLTDEQWPYGTIRVIALSKSVSVVPNSLAGRVEIYSGEISNLIAELEAEGFRHAYIDGGATITSFINEKRINEITLTQAPVLLGSGKPLFGHIKHQVNLVQAQAQAFANDFIQTKYMLSYDN
ncbi:dihydrofolate reductase family protein [Agaribacterium sp. ZY112]|uniref:dihydrofolate reductase family protein n=1 Tax=Agaribacterium sp. ZY112 TaxID=3233574 RepID=UPI00352428CA